MSITALPTQPLGRPLTAVAGIALTLAVLVLLLDAPVWLVKLVPTQDGPVHLAQADLIARFGWGGAMSEPAATFYQWNPRVEPNSAVYLLLAGLIRLTGDPLVANTLFLSLYGALWVAAALVAARAETRQPLLPLLLLLPVAFGIFIHWGFYNFALGMPLFLLFGGFWRRLDGRRDATAFIATALFLLALFLTHITTVVAACLLLAADGVSRALQTLDRAGFRAATRRLVIDGAWAIAAALPVLLMIASFLLAYQNIPGETAGADGGLTQIVRRIVAATCLFSFSWWEVAALAPLLGAMVVAAALALRHRRSGDLLWPIFFALVVLLSLMNLKTGSALLSERLAPYSWIAVVLALASRQPHPALARTLCIAALCGLAGQSALRGLAYESWAPVLEGELAAGRAHPGRTFVNVDRLPLRSSRDFAWRVRPTLHANQTLALAAGGVGLSSPLPSTRYFGYFPLQYVEARDFMRASKDWIEAPDAGAIAAFRRQSAPPMLVVTASGEDGATLAHELGYDACQTSAVGTRRLSVCTPLTRLSAR